MNIDKKLILIKIKTEKKIKSDASFARKIGITPQNLAKWYERNTFDVDKIINAFPDVNHVWLLTGEGEILKASGQLPATQVSHTIPLLPIAAQGGSLGNFIASIKARDCEKIASPIKGVDFAMTVSGDSMEPEYPSGGKILIKKINEKAFIEWGRVYVLDTCNGSVIKKIMPGPDPASVTCQSINDQYPPFTVAYADMYGVYRVLMLLSEK